MNEKRAVGFVLGLILFLGSCTTARISSAEMTTGVDEKGRPIDEVLTYKPDAQKFVCVADIRNAPSDTKITFVWVYKTGNVEIDKVEVILPESKSINATLTRGDNPWPLGEYVVRIYIDQKKEPADLVAFRVKD